MSGRPVSLRGACNFRDLGGYETTEGRAVRHGRAFRSDGLHRLEPHDEAELDRMGIGRVFDLRSDVELAKDGVGSFARTHGHSHVPLVAISLSPFDPSIDWRTIDLQDRYLEMLRAGGPSIRAVFEALAEPNAPAIVFHCTGGKDRTGVVAAVLLRTLGVRDDDVVSDYAESEHHLRDLLTRFRAELVDLGMDEAAIAYLTSSPPDRMRRTLASLDREWGSTGSYLAAIGVTPRVVDRLRANLLD